MYENTKFVYRKVEKQKRTGTVVQLGFKDYRPRASTERTEDPGDEVAQSDVRGN